MEGAKRPWSDWYWAHVQSGTAYRWMKNEIRYNLLSKSAVMRMSREELQELSPAEKFDIYMGRYDFPTVKYERNRTRGSRAEWEGICDGWSPASYLHTEPAPVDLKNKDGVVVPFGSSDVKALLSFYYALVSDSNTWYVGRRCDNATPVGRACVNDINAGAFHIVLANQIGVLDESMVIEISRDNEIWNQPVISYRSQEVSRQTGRFGKTFVRMKTQLVFASETMPKFYPVIGSPFQIEEPVNYEYTLELNRKGQIVGGVWHSEEQPDFLWGMNRSRFGNSYYGSIIKVYRARSL